MVQVEAATAEQVKLTVLKQDESLHVVTLCILPREQEAACSSAGGGAGLTIAGCPALYLTGDLTHDGPEHEAMSLFCPSLKFSAYSNYIGILGYWAQYRPVLC